MLVNVEIEQTATSSSTPPRDVRTTEKAVGLSYQEYNAAHGTAEQLGTGEVRAQIRTEVARSTFDVRAAARPGAAG